MKTLVVYDSAYGNTEKVAQGIAGAIGSPDQVDVALVGKVDLALLRSAELLIVGSPTQGGRPTVGTQGFLTDLPPGSLHGVGVAAFDTRLPWLFVKVFGFAAGRIAKGLTAKGGRLVAPPQGFFVTGKEGPLRAGELERAAAWAKAVVQDRRDRAA